MSYSEVPRIALNEDGTVTIYVNVGGFKPNTPVEISGYATQTNGAVATFFAVQPMPVPKRPDYGVIMVVSGVPVIGSTFAPADPIMVVARATDAWISKLPQDSGAELSPEMQEAIADEVNIQAAWSSDEKSYHSVYGPKW
jgi:hypothetical protein